VTTIDAGPSTPASSGLPLRRGLLVASLLSIFYLVGTAYTTVVSLVNRVESTDVMAAVSDDIWSARIASQMAYFMTAQVALHLAMGALAWLLARATLELWPGLRQKFVRVVVGWFSLLAGAALAFNALWYPRTFFGAHYHDSTVARLGPLHVGQWIYGSVSIAAALVLLAAGVHVYQQMHAGRRRRWLAVVATVIALAGAAVLVDRFDLFSRVHASKQPNVILLGIDSLRLEELERFGGKAGRLAHVDEFLKDADVVRDASTPMPRTYGSWVSILSGRSPAVTGARNNLTPRDEVVPNPTIADVLRQHGYQTVYSTDEVRFANIDESFGFDKVVTPPIGASDFIIGTYNELPLASVVINTRLGQVLFPFSYGNRGAATMFEPATYLGRLDRELHFDRPTFLIVHLTAAHWPYYTAETPFGVSVKKHPEDRPMYRIGLKTVDAMYGQVISMLRRKGALDNAIVVTLSDHGEALALPNDSFMKNGAFVKNLGSPLKVLDVGHGQSVLSQTQYKILLGFRTFAKAGGVTSQGRDLPQLTTTEDIAPTLLDLLGIDASPLQSQGESLAAVLRAEGTPAVPAGPERIRFTETDLSVIPAPDGTVDEVSTAKAVSSFFGIDPSSSRIFIRHNMLPLARAYKERAAFTSRHLLAALPAGPDAHQYVYFDIATGGGELLLARPGPELDEGQRLWDALTEHFAGELMTPRRIRVQDWPVIATQWRKYFSNPHTSTLQSETPAGGAVETPREPAATAH
jgi:hypothetical protein